MATHHFAEVGATLQEAERVVYGVLLKGEAVSGQRHDLWGGRERFG